MQEGDMEWLEMEEEEELGEESEEEEGELEKK
jgi:hypothetical protein